MKELVARHGQLREQLAAREVMEDVAIVEWMGASPVYSIRSQHAFGFHDGNVPTIMKNLQLDIGSPHQFMDFRCRVEDGDHGEFWLAHCGALLDVEPLGDDYVHGMCHAIEDPTFDATAGATNPRAQVRPIHRPPRVPADQVPHCRWTVEIDPAFDPVYPHPNRALVEASLIADLIAARREEGAVVAILLWATPRPRRHKWRRHRVPRGAEVRPHRLRGHDSPARRVPGGLRSLLLSLPAKLQEQI